MGDTRGVTGVYMIINCTVWLIQLTQLDQDNFIGTKVYFQSLFLRKEKKN
jgi:hypothetical protein